MIGRDIAHAIRPCCSAAMAAESCQNYVDEYVKQNGQNVKGSVAAETFYHWDCDSFDTCESCS